MITVPLPEDNGLHGDGRPKVRRFRSHLLDLGRRPREFRREHGLTQMEIARVVGAGSDVTVCQWETGTHVPNGHPRERLVELLEGRFWHALREVIIEGEGIPGRWCDAARWYRRASRERASRETVGSMVAVILDNLRQVDSSGVLRERYCEDDGSGARELVVRLVPNVLRQSDLWRVEDAAFGLRWVELAHGIQLDLNRSLARQLPLELLERAINDPTTKSLEAPLQR
ncbi:MAG: helix-turn-helix domain-containing protein [Chloroflexi bacterium]|nr:helix-turn-helix domain-containing protein [Chloroflexota bacterium]